MRAFQRGAVLLLAAVSCGCAFQSERIVLLPSQDGHPAAVVVKQGDRQVVLDKPYAATELGVADPWPYRASEVEINAGFGDALAAQPSRSASFTLYFVEGSDELTEASKRTLESVFADLRERAVPDVLVVGHTDAVGTPAFNDDLARKRADAVKAMLVGRGVRADDIVAIGRGKRELLVPTADGIAEPRNRRVEIVVR
ncbi:MAG TPA: OmpA family protein [Casimicrobiaceae bacterium]|nr:OmpA family protein [Casimicrobiaceae bacterium]